jgi:hypothetical protein
LTPKRTEYSSGIYQLHQLEIAVEFELRIWIMNREHGFEAPSGHTFGGNVGNFEGSSSYTSSVVLVP